LNEVSVSHVVFFKDFWSIHSKKKSFWPGGKKHALAFVMEILFAASCDFLAEVW